MIKRFKLVLVVLAAVFMMGATPAYAQFSLGGGGFGGGGGGSSCGGTKTEFIACSGGAGVGAIGDLVRIALMVMTIGVGIVAVGGFAYASILYASAHDDQNKVSQARTIIRNNIIGLVLYGMTVAIIAWLLPGAVINTPSASPSPSGSPGATNLPTNLPQGANNLTPAQQQQLLQQLQQQQQN